MASFDSTSALLGGCLIGLASALLMVLNGRIAGVSGILGGALSTTPTERGWRFAFLAGLIGAPILMGLAGRPLADPQMPTSWLLIGVAGLLVGFGSRLGGGCTSGHGVCGMARFSTRSIIATIVFMATAAIVVALMRHVLGN